MTKEAQEDPEIMAGELEKAFIENINANGRSMDPFSYYQEGLEQLAVASATYEAAKCVYWPCTPADPSTGLFPG